MPHKNPATDRSHGGPGSSHETPIKPGDETHRRASGGHSNAPPPPGAPTSPSRSTSSGGGGEQDKHHTHDPDFKS